MADKTKTEWWKARQRRLGEELDQADAERREHAKAIEAEAAAEVSRLEEELERVNRDLLMAHARLIGARHELDPNSEPHVRDTTAFRDMMASAIEEATRTTLFPDRRRPPWESAGAHWKLGAEFRAIVDQMVASTSRARLMGGPHSMHREAVALRTFSKRLIDPTSGKAHKQTAGIPETVLRELVELVDGHAEARGHLLGENFNPKRPDQNLIGEELFAGAMEIFTLLVGPPTLTPNDIAKPQDDDPEDTGKTTRATSPAAKLAEAILEAVFGRLDMKVPNYVRFARNWRAAQRRAENGRP